MNPDILATSGDLVFMPVRHHSPACARATRELAQELRPTAILIEGPSDFNERLDELYLPHTLPIAIYSYVRLGEGAAGGVLPVLRALAGMGGVAGWARAWRCGALY